MHHENLQKAHQDEDIAVATNLNWMWGATPWSKLWKEGDVTDIIEMVMTWAIIIIPDNIKMSAIIMETP